MALEYQSVRFIKVQHTKLAIAHYFLTGLILLYVIIYSIVIEKGYQEYENLVGTTFIKTKGTGIDDQGRIFDAYDVVNPAVEANALFIATSTAETYNQTRGICSGNKDVEACESDADCLARNGTFTENGQILDTCAPLADGASQRYCFMNAWCEIEPATVIQNQIGNIEQSTVWVVANVVFPKFQVNRSTSGYENSTGPLYPAGNAFFTAETFAREAGQSWADITARGAIIMVTIEYDCDINRGGGDDCDPTLTFQRLDIETPGFNYRYVTYTIDENGDTIRTLNKVLGLRVLFQVHGRAGRFSIVNLLTALGAGLALLSIATLVCDFILQYLIPGKEKYVRQKFAHVRQVDGDEPDEQTPISHTPTPNSNYARVP